MLVFTTAENEIIGNAPELSFTSLESPAPVTMQAMGNDLFRWRTLIQTISEHPKAFGIVLCWDVCLSPSCDVSVLSCTQVKSSG